MPEPEIFTLATGEKIEVLRELNEDESQVTYTTTITTNHVIDPNNPMDSNRYAFPLTVYNN